MMPIVPDQTEQLESYRGQPLIQSEREAMLDLEQTLGQPIPLSGDVHWRSFGYEVRANRIMKLAIHAKNLTMLPPSFANFKRLHYLYIGENNFTQLPDLIGGLSHLMILVVDSNKLTNLPSTIGDLGALHTLDVSKNNLKSLPVSIRNLKSLRIIDIAGNPDLRIPVTLERWLMGLGQRGGAVFR